VSADLAPSAGEDVATDYNFYATASGSATGATFARLMPTGGSSGSSTGIFMQRTPAPSPSGLTASAIVAWINPACVYTSATSNFVCPTLTWMGHSLSVSYTLFDSLGVAQSQYSPTLTASVALVVSDTGAVAYTWNNNSFADTSSHHRNVTLSNLLGSPDTLHIWNGVGSTAIHSVRSGQITKTYQLSSNDTTTNVAIRQPHGLNPYPLSGTIVRNYSVVRTKQASDTTTHSATRRVVVTFNGTADVPMTVGTETYSLNLDSHRVTKQ